MATIFDYRNKIHIEYSKDGFRVRENLGLIPNDENWAIAVSKKKEVEALYETKNENSLIKKLLKKELESSDLTVYQAIEKYQHHISTGSHKHQETFVYAMSYFIKIADPSVRVEKITSAVITEYLKLLKAKNLANSTQRTYYTYIKLFFNYLVKEDLLVKSPCRNVPSPKEVEKEIITFGTDLLNTILEEAKMRDYKLYLLFVFLSLTGMRINDALKLTPSHFVLNENFIKLNVSKTSVYTKFPIYGELKNFIESEMKPLLDVTQDEKIFNGYTVNCVGLRFRRIKKQLNIPNNYTITLKTFRKTLATRMLNGGVRLEFVSKLLSHKKVQTTAKYYASTELNSIQAEIKNSSVQILPKKIQE
ncbi:MAG: site-specific integrase [Ignavibacteria bacterium]|nr:site-specific integrase [Ignavibacteria bacterium]